MPSDTISDLPDPREKKRYYIQPTFMRWIAISSAKALYGMFSYIRLSGVELLPGNGPVVLAANHLSNYDPFPIQFAVPRPIYFMAKAELHRNPMMDALLRQLGSFPINRGTGDEWAMRHARLVLEKGEVLGIFPEGTRSKGRGLAVAKTGAARLALASACPVVPLAIDGTQRMFKRFPRRNPLEIRIGAPIYPQPDMSPLDFTDSIMFSLADLLPMAMRGAYTHRPQGFNF